MSSPPEGAVEAGPAASSPASRAALGGIAAIALLAIVETVVALAAPSRAPTDGDWQAAAVAVRQGFRSGDLIVAAPAWADPILRVHLGDLIPPAVAARLDDARFPRVWEVAQRGARSPEGQRGDVRGDWSFGHLRLRLVERAAPAVTYDFVAQAADGRAAVRAPGGTRPAGLQSQIVEVDQRLRRALVIQPVAGGTVVVDFPAVPLGRELAIATGLHDTWMRKAARGTVQARLSIGERAVPLPETTNDSGWTETRVDTRAEEGRSLPVRLEITSPDPRDRLFAFAAEARR